MQRSRAHRVPERGLGEQPGRVVGILDIGHTDCRIGDTVINYGIHGHGNAVLGQHLKCKTQISGINSPSKPTIVKFDPVIYESCDVGHGRDRWLCNGSSVLCNQS